MKLNLMILRHKNCSDATRDKIYSETRCGKVNMVSKNSVNETEGIDMVGGYVDNVSGNGVNANGNVFVSYKGKRVHPKSKVEYGKVMHQDKLGNQ